MRQPCRLLLLLLPAGCYQKCGHGRLLCVLPLRSAHGTCGTAVLLAIVPVYYSVVSIPVLYRAGVCVHTRYELGGGATAP